VGQNKITNLSNKIIKYKENANNAKTLSLNILKGILIKFLNRLNKRSKQKQIAQKAKETPTNYEELYRSHIESILHKRQYEKSILWVTNK
jgi:hypothetical protein